MYVVTKGKVSDDCFKSLEKLHTELYLSGLKGADKIEASYVPQEDLAHFNPEAVRPYFNEGKFLWATYSNNWLIELSVLREKEIIIVGPDIKTLLSPISHEDLNRAIYKNLEEYWIPLLNNESKLRRTDYQIFAVLTMCRTLYTLQHGTITSKQKAAEWAKVIEGNHFSDLIEQAATWKSGGNFNHYDDTRKFIEYTFKKSNAN